MSLDQSATIHPTAIIEDGAQIGANCKIGPYSIVGAEVKLAAGVELISHVVVAGRTSIGEETRVWPFASLGHQPQDLKFHGEASELIIGKRNMIREHATMNPGTEGGGMVTRVGDGGLFMMSTHIGHDCIIGDNVILANNAAIAGHVHMGDNVVVGGQAGIHQWVRLGEGSMIGAVTGIFADVIPFGTVTGARGDLSGLNLVGLKRRGVARAEIHALRNAYKLIFNASEGTLSTRAQAAQEAYPDSELVRKVTDFIQFDSDRAICTP